MTPRLLANAALFLLLLAVLAFHWWATPDLSRPNVEFLPQMAHGARYNAYAANPNFPDGKTLQAPIAGTVARGALPLHYSPAAADALRAGNELLRPAASETPRARARGEHVFRNYCAVCHGADGAGIGTVTQRGVPPPPSLLASHALQMKDGHMFHVLTYGQNNMASYAGQLSRDDRWNVIVYVRALQKAAAPAPAEPVKAAANPPAATGGAR